MVHRASHVALPSPLYLPPLSSFFNALYSIYAPPPPLELDAPPFYAAVQLPYSAEPKAPSPASPPRQLPIVRAHVRSPVIEDHAVVLAAMPASTIFSAFT